MSLALRAASLALAASTILPHTILASLGRIGVGITLYPGDLVATGTPEGVGMGMTPPRWLRTGDVVRIEVKGVGQLEHTVI
jgi:2-keto-4-pentenoate hydratase/2-oxohepta-3-ene-1,7-dioic acid hydratase in catechol pathway